MKTLYHATRVENMLGIRDEGLKAGIDGMVHLTTSPEKAIAYVALYTPQRPLDIAVYKVKLPDGLAQPFSDGLMSGNDHFVHEGDIETGRVQLLRVVIVGGARPSMRGK